MRKEKKQGHWIRNILISLFSLGIVCFILMVAPDYKRDEITDRINLVINNNNITANLKNDVIVDGKGVVYVSEKDLENFFDSYIYFDADYKQMITTSDTKVATLELGKKQMAVNGIMQDTLGSLTEKDGVYYLPFSDLNTVYNIEIEYIKENNRVVVTSLDRKLEKADASKDLSVKWKQKDLSRTLEKVKKGDKIVVISEDNGWAKIRTSLGNIGYVKTKDLANRIVVRDKMETSTRLNEKVSLVWDYYSEYASAPDRTGENVEGINVISPAFFSLERLGKGEIYDNAKSAGKEYVEWAHNNGLEVWPIFSNNSMPETTREIVSDYKLRQKTIENILDLAVEYEVDGINLDFEYMYEEDKDLYTRFIIELLPRLHEYGMSLSVDVTAPDGSPMWSECFDRYDIANNCDYIIFMAYDQHNEDNKPGPNDGYDWIDVNLNKFLRDIESDKIILALPLYTRTWEYDTSKGTVPHVVDMSGVEKTIPSDANIYWDDTVKQNIAEYTKNGSRYTMWIDDLQSLGVRLDLCNERNLAGVAFWAKDRESDGVWSLVKEKIL